jgi:hypothetical protein
MQTYKGPVSRTRRVSVCRLLAAASAILALLVLLSPSQMRAQLVTGDVLGTVTDTSGAVVPGAKVTLTNTGTGIARTMTSNETGEFIFSNQQIGTMKVLVEAKGFKNFSVADIVLTAGQRLRVEAKLEIGSAVETVQVEAVAAVQLQADSSNISSEIATTNMVELPTNGRNYYNLVGLQAGVKTGGGSGDPTDNRQKMDFQANGQSSYYNNNMIDGMDNNMVSLGTVAVTPSLDALEQVQVETSNYSAEYSRTGGGIANLITKSGTNAFHGSAFEFMRNDAFDANPWAANKFKTKLRQNQYGASLGGPIIKNKAFFFADYQGWRQVKGSAGQQLVMFDDDYNAVHAFAEGTSQSMTISDRFDAWQGGGTGNQITSSSITNPVLGTVQNPVSPLGLAQLMALPMANVTAETCGTRWDPGTETCTGSRGQYNWTGPLDTTQNATTYDGRVDYHFNDKNTLFGRFSHNLTSTQGTGKILPPAEIVPGDPHLWAGHDDTNNVADNNVALDFVHIFNPTTIFEAKASFARAANDVSGHYAHYWTSEQLGVTPAPGYDSSEMAGMMPMMLNGLPRGAYSGPYAGVNDLAGRYAAGNMDAKDNYFNQNTYQYVASLIMNRKSHSLKAGVTLLRRQVNSSNASITFLAMSPIYTGNTLSDILEGFSASVAANAPMVPFHGRFWEPSVYFQDDWRATKSLTLNLGVRWDVYTPETAREGNISNFDPVNMRVISPSLLGEFKSGPTAGVTTDWKDISPRIGFAYTLPGNNPVTSNMVLRGGVGLSYFPGSSGTLPGSHLYQLMNAPFIWSMACGRAEYRGGSNCGVDNNVMDAALYNAMPYGINAVDWAASHNGDDYPFMYNGNDFGAGGFLLEHGLPAAQFDTAKATDTSNYASSLAANMFMMPNFKPSYLYQFNLQVQKQVGNNIMTAGFVGNLGRRMPSFQNLNTPITGPAAACPPGGGPPGSLCFDKTQYPLYSAEHDYMGSVAVGESISGGNSRWLAGEATYERRMSGGLTASVNYTWARTQAQNTAGSFCVVGCQVDDGNGGSVAYSGWQQYGWSGSTSHRVAGMVTYQIPYGRNLKGILGAAFHGWQLAGTGNWNTGNWTTISSGVQQSGMNAVPTVNMNGGQEYPSWTPGHAHNATNPKKDLNDWIDPTAFTLQPKGVLGNAVNPSVQGPRSRNLDLGLDKTFSIAELFKIQFRAEAFNLTNTPSYSFSGGGGGAGGGGPPPGGGGGATGVSNYCTAGTTYVAPAPGPPGAPPGQATCSDGSLANKPGDVGTSGGNPSFGKIAGTSSESRILQFGIRLIY